AASSSAARPPWPAQRGPTWRPARGPRGSGRSSFSIWPPPAPAPPPTPPGRPRGPQTGPARRLRARLPDAEIVLGGGVRGRDDLLALAAGGYQAALVGTALHTGVLGPADLSLRS